MPIGAEPEAPMETDGPASRAEAAEGTVVEPTPPRLVSLDAFRGFVMILMVLAGLGIHGMVEIFVAKPEWRHLKTP